MKRLGELYELHEQPAKAVEAYSRLVRLWSHADPELQTIVNDVRRRIAPLSNGEPVQR